MTCLRFATSHNLGVTFYHCFWDYVAVEGMQGGTRCLQLFAFTMTNSDQKDSKTF